MSKLNGVLEISRYLGVSEVTVMTLHKDKNFPMSNNDSVWEADTDEISKWRGQTVAEKKKPVKKPVKKTTKKIAKKK